MIPFPKSGQIVVVRGRPGVVRDITTTQAKMGPVQLVSIQYVDGTSIPREESVAWTRETTARVVSTLNLPYITNSESFPDDISRLRAFIDSFQWLCANKLVAKREAEEATIELVSPFHNAVRIEDYQLKPVLKSLLMPRVSLLLADDVGLGKTIEAGLILAELYARSRVQRAMVLCPASLQVQWQEELHDKFHVDFEIVDRNQSDKAKRLFGIDSNPWQIYPRIITSMDYLRQPDVMESFRSCANRATQSPQLPWQMLIVDEAHNLAPSVFSDDSDRCRMLRQITRYFEHKLFLSATPHNGYTVTFSGLLSILDPVRIQQTSVLYEDDHKQICLLMVRRLKSELNKGAHGQRFPHREVEGLPLTLRSNPQEMSLYEQLRRYRKALLGKSTSISGRERRVCDFVITLLTKRLLSSTYSFARTWWRHVEGLQLQDGEIEETENSIRKAETEQGDDEVKVQREEDAARQAGSWLTRFSKEFSKNVEEISASLNAIGWSAEIVQSEELIIKGHRQDLKVGSLVGWIKSHLMTGNKFLDTERLIIFTEYKDTLNYLEKMLEVEGFKYPQVDFMYGGMDRAQRTRIKDAFNDPLSPVRILIATDTAAEGLNLQTSCRYVLHFEIPWNPMRLEQRNGRVDRHGQARDVTVYHFASDEDADLKLLSHVIKKVNQAREDLGSLGQVIDQSVIEHFTRRELDTKTLDERLEKGKVDKQDSADTGHSDTGSEEEYEQAIQRLKNTEKSLGLFPHRMAQLLGHAIQMEGGVLRQLEDDQVYRIEKVPPSWATLVERSLAIQRGALQSALPKLVFDPAFFETIENGRQVFRTRKDSVLIRLGHPLMRRAISTLQRKLWDSGNASGIDGNTISRWTITSAPLPKELNTVALLHCLLEVTNNLRETSHQELLHFPLSLTGNGPTLIGSDTWVTLEGLPRVAVSHDSLPAIAQRVKTKWVEVEDEVKSILKQQKLSWVQEMTKRFESRQKEELRETKKDYETRIRDIDKRDADWLKKQKREFEKQMAKLSQQELFVREEIGKEHAVKELEWEIFHSENQQLRQLLVDEQQRMIEQIIPGRFSLGNLEFWPIAVEFIVGEGA